MVAFLLFTLCTVTDTDLSETILFSRGALIIMLTVLVAAAVMLRPYFVNIIYPLEHSSLKNTAPVFI